MKRLAIFAGLSMTVAVACDETTLETDNQTTASNSPTTGTGAGDGEGVGGSGGNTDTGTTSGTTTGTGTGGDPAGACLDGRISATTTTGPSDYDGTPPEISFELDADRKLIFANNPEQIQPTDLNPSPGGGRAREIYRIDPLPPGKYRYFYTFVNRTQANLFSGVQFVNKSGNQTTELRVNGRGFHLGGAGGKPFRQMFETYEQNPAVEAVGPQFKTTWLIGNNAPIVGTSTPINTLAATGQFFSAAIDFEWPEGQGDAILKLIVWDNAPPNSTPIEDIMGYDDKPEPDGSNAARVYKGIADQYLARASNLNYEFDDEDSTGVLPVRYANYILEPSTSGSGGGGGAETTGPFGPITTRRDGWISNIGTAQNPNAVMTDMVEFTLKPPPGPELTFSPYFRTFHGPDWPSEGLGQPAYSNLGNWGIEYVLSGTLENNGTQPRTVLLNLQAPEGGGTNFAFTTEDDEWCDVSLDRGQSIAVQRFEVSAGGSVNYSARYVLGGPANGAIRSYLTLED